MYYFDPKTNRRSEYSNGQPKRRNPADPRDKPSCRGCPKCASLPPEQQTPRGGSRRTLSAKNWRTLEVYYELQAAGASGARVDGLTRRNLGIVARTLADHERLRGLRVSALLQALSSRSVL